MKKYIGTLAGVCIAIVLFFIPFGWLKPGEMDLGGDNSRLYFYDPVAYLSSQALYSVSHSGLGGEILSFYGIPFFLLLAAVKSLVSSPTILISVFHGINLSLGFFFCYRVVKELLRDEEKGNSSEIAGILAGLYYAFSPNPVRWWGYPLLSMNLVFINPLLFFLMLRFFITKRISYMLTGVLVTFLFSPNFSFAGAPTFFSFFPLAGLFLLCYLRFVRQRAIPVKQLIVGLLLFLGVQAFHLIPQVSSILTPGSTANEFIFSGQRKLDWGLKYFLATVPAIKVSHALLGLPQYTNPETFWMLFMIFPALFLLGLLWQRSRLLLLAAVFFLISLYFVSANVTKLGVTLYALAFRLPGFAMFRVFYGQWQWTYLFFYTVLTGLALSTVLKKIKARLRLLLVGAILGLFAVVSWPLITGSLTDTTLWQSKDISSHVQMDPQYEEALGFIRTLPVDGKIISFPLNDYGYQVVKGANDAAYEGPSTISYIAGRNEFNGAAEFGVFEPPLLAAARKGDIAEFRDIMSLLNIRYIFYNEDPYIYGENFPGLPYSNARKYFPDSQEGYKEFIRALGVRKIKTIAGKYHVFEFDDPLYTPHIYTAKDVAYWNDYVAADPHMPLTFYPDDKRVALFDDRNIYSRLKDMFDVAYLKARNTSTIFDFFKKKKLDRFVTPTVSRKLTSPIYPLVILRERRSLAHYPVGSDAYIDRSMYLAEKRVNELYVLHDIPVLGDVKSITDLAKKWKEPELWDIGRFRQYNSWEVTLARYVKAIEKLIGDIEITDASDYSNITSKVELKRYLREHKLKLRSAIRDQSSLSVSERKYLSLLIEDMFVELYQMLKLDLPDYSNVPFVIDDQLGDETYEVYVHKKDLKNIPITLSIDGEILPQISDTGEWMRFRDIAVVGKQVLPIILSINNPPNLVEHTQWKTAESLLSGGNVRFQWVKTESDMGNKQDALTLEIMEADLGDTSGAVRDIEGWEGDTMYALSFDYLTYDRNFQMVLRERGGVKTDAYMSDVYEETLRSREWRNLSIVVASAKDADTAFLQITKAFDDVVEKTSNQIKKIEIKNLSVRKIYNPTIVLRSTLRPEASNPRITVTQVNPTKYEVRVEEADGPFALVFSQEFNQKWKLFYPAGENRAKTVKGTIMRVIGAFGRSLAGKVHRINPKTFETWGVDPIAEKTHLPVNGYANAWYIRPEDIGNQKDVTLVIEMTSQKVFYVSVFVTLVALGLTVSLLIVDGVTKRL